MSANLYGYPGRQFPNFNAIISVERPPADKPGSARGREQYLILIMVHHPSFLTL
jgi:hypothetical protein